MVSQQLVGDLFTNDTSGEYDFTLGVWSGNYYNLSVEITAADGLAKDFSWQWDTFWTYPERASVVVFAVTPHEALVQWHTPGVEKDVNLGKTVYFTSVIDRKFY